MERKRIRPFTKEERAFRRIYREAFPKSERMPVFLFFCGSGKEFDLWLEEGEPVAFTLVEEDDSVALLYYLAVDRKTRGKGIGREIIRTLRKEKGERLAVIAESVKGEFGKDETRQRRRNFYLSCGFLDAGFTVEDYSGPYDAYSFSPIPPKAEEVIRLMKKTMPFGTLRETKEDN